ncbi:hypothetical protein J2X68_001745 [Streptomyces sp. 3330]|uniref:hypothetical protein n=1 Tax=Streptomyces sp. 3330 TaxID=2817755 RepID=UPI0028572BE7|nr:hypothetical protein [Streptomyces sp. 3330]MDR6975061.1 hypothetical protein [Streptomyces sp. 3330]
MAASSDTEGGPSGDGGTTATAAGGDAGSRGADGTATGEPAPEPASGADGEPSAPDGERGTAGAAPARAEGDREEADTSADPPVMDMARLGTITATVVTVIAALGGLILGVRAEQRAVGDERRAMDQDAEADEREASTYPRLVDFYRHMSTLTVVNSSSRVMEMRLVLKSPDVWWDLQALPPCGQFDIPTGLLKSSMSAEEPSVTKHLTDRDLDRLRLELRDPNGKVWSLASGALFARAADWKQSPGGVRLISSEPWNMKPEKSPTCE